MLTPKELTRRLIQSGLCAPVKLRGCSDNDLSRIEKHFGCRLPTEYKKLMEVLGRVAGEFMSDLEMFYPRVITLTDRMRELVADSLKLPDDAFVFANRYGEQFLFFHTGGADDPPIYRWHDEEPERVRRVFKSLWRFIE